MRIEVRGGWQQGEMAGAAGTTVLWTTLKERPQPSPPGWGTRSPVEAVAGRRARAHELEEQQQGLRGHAERARVDEAEEGVCVGLDERLHLLGGHVRKRAAHACAGRAGRGPRGRRRAVEGGAREVQPESASGSGLRQVEGKQAGRQAALGSVPAPRTGDEGGEHPAIHLAALLHAARRLGGGLGARRLGGARLCGLPSLALGGLRGCLVLPLLGQLRRGGGAGRVFGGGQVAGRRAQGAERRFGGVRQGTRGRPGSAPGRRCRSCRRGSFGRA